MEHIKSTIGIRTASFLMYQEVLLKSICTKHVQISPPQHKNQPRVPRLLPSNKDSNNWYRSLSTMEDNILLSNTKYL
jgi:hypothetical protein